MSSRQFSIQDGRGGNWSRSPPRERSPPPNGRSPPRGWSPPRRGRSPCRGRSPPRRARSPCRGRSPPHRGRSPCRGRSPPRRARSPCRGLFPPRKGFGGASRRSPFPRRLSPIRRHPLSRGRRSPQRSRSPPHHRRSQSPRRRSLSSSATSFTNSSANTFVDWGAQVKVDPDSFKRHSFQTGENKLKKKEWPNFSFGQAPESFKDNKRIDRGETKGNVIKNQSLESDKEKLDKGEPLVPFSFVKTVKDETRANMNNNSSFPFTFVKHGDVKFKKREPDLKSKYVENSAMDSKTAISEVIEKAYDTKGSETDDALSSFRFVKSSIIKETFNDLGTKNMEKCKYSFDQSNDSTTGTKYFGNLFNVPKSNPVFRSIKATGSIFDQNLLDLRMNVELNDQNEREVHIKKSKIYT